MLVRLTLAFASAHRMVDRVLDHTANMRANSEPTRSVGLTEYHVFMLFVAYLTDGSHALKKYESELSAGHTDKGIFALFRHKLCGNSG